MAPESEAAADRPAAIACQSFDDELRCWPCYREGFETPNPAAPVEEDL